MTKEDLNQMCREYQQVLSMSETEVFAMYEESKSECIASYEAEIDFWENYFGYRIDDMFWIEFIYDESAVTKIILRNVKA